VNKLTATTSQVRGILRRLRPPSGRPLSLRFPYTFDQKANPGITVSFQSGESAIAMGNGTVTAAQPVQPFWAFSPGSLHASRSSYQVVIDHGFEVRTVVHGLSSVNVRVGQAVTRGEVIGTPLTDEVFLAVLYHGNAYDPQSVSRHFKAQNGNIVVNQGGFLRYAPDFTVRDLSDGIISTLVNGVRYFVPRDCQSPPFLLNIDFNGNGSKEGLAAVGISGSDFWNVYTPVEFIETEVIPDGYIGCIGSEFNISPMLDLRNYDAVTSVIRMERISPMSVQGGSAVRFDPMLSTWIGGSDPVTNVIKLRGVPAGTFKLYLYTGEVGALTDFYVSINGGAPSTASATPTANNSFVENNNYVVFDLVLSAYAVLTIQGVGSWSGLQLKRL
jgi:hypothetical protein